MNSERDYHSSNHKNHVVMNGDDDVDDETVQTLSKASTCIFEITLTMQATIWYLLNPNNSVHVTTNLPEITMEKVKKKMDS